VDVECVDARFRAAAAAAAERLDWALLLRESMALEAAREDGLDCLHACQLEVRKKGERRPSCIQGEGTYTHDAINRFGARRRKGQCGTRG
jgi:hypothetical protein